MNPQVQQAIDNINQFIIENHNNEITADVLNPILVEIANLWGELVGDLSDSSVDGDTIIEMINQLQQNIEDVTGLTVHTGQPDPNITPPTTYSAPDLYVRLTPSNIPYEVYIYNGIRWVLIDSGITKISEQWASYVLTGVGGLPILPQINENNRNINITGNPTGLSSLGGFVASGGASIANFWDGMTAKVLNSSPNNQTIKHNYSLADIKYLFPNEEDYTIRPNEVVYFDLKGGNLVFRYSTISSKLEKDIFSDVTVGAITAGDTLDEGTTFTEFVEQLLTKTFYPTFTPYSISGSAGSSVEVGTGTKTITVNFTRGDIVGDSVGGVWNPTLVQGQVLGDANKYWINGIDNGTSNSASVSEITTLGTNTVNIAVDYDAGAQPKDSKGDNYLTPEPAGTLNGVATWSGFYYRTAIAGNSVPTASDIRSETTSRRSNAGVINMPTGTTNVRFDVFVPQSSSLTSAIDEGNLNLNITAEFILQGSNFSGQDANGDEVLYKHYVRIVDNPYTVSSNIAITVT